MVGQAPQFHLKICESVANPHYLARLAKMLKCLKFPFPEFSTVDMCRQYCASAYEFLTMVTKGVVHGVYMYNAAIGLAGNALV